MSISIEVVSTELNLRSGTSQKTGRPYNLREQIAYVHKEGTRYPEKIKIMLDDNQPPYQAGFYELSPKSFYVDRYESLTVKPILIPRPVNNLKAS